MDAPLAMLFAQLLQGQQPGGLQMGPQGAAGLPNAAMMQPGGIQQPPGGVPNGPPNGPPLGVPPPPSEQSQWNRPPSQPGSRRTVR